MLQSFSFSDWREIVNVSRGYDDDDDTYPVDNDYVESDIDVERLRGD